MVIGERQSGAVTVLKPEGPIVASEAMDLRTRMDQAMKDHLGRVILDMSAVPLVDSEGLEALLDVSDHALTTGRWLKLCAANRTIREVLELTGLSNHFEHYEDTGSAVRSFL